MGDWNGLEAAVQGAVAEAAEIVKVVEALTKLGILCQAPTWARVGQEWLGFVKRRKDRYGEWRRDFVPVCQIVAIDGTKALRWHEDVTNPAALLLTLLEKYRAKNAAVEQVVKTSLPGRGVERR